VVDEVDRLVELEMLGQVVVEEEELLPAKVLDVLQRPGFEVVNADDPLAPRKQLVAEVRAYETGTAGDDRRAHQIM
jgi:hypothetical protein